MNALWSYFWPVFAGGLAIGAIAASFALHRDRRNLAWTVGVGATIASAALWHGPFGGADRYTAHVERMAREALVYYEMTQVTAHLHHAPLTRELVLSGEADDFQHSELQRLLSQIPGVRDATWTPSRGIPLIVEGTVAGLAGFLLGAALAYLVELRRRYNAQWKW